MTDGDVLRSRFGSRVKFQLALNGLTVGDLATMSRIPVARLHRILGGTYARVTLRDMNAVANALEVTLYSLLAPVAELEETVLPDDDRR